MIERLSDRDNNSVIQADLVIVGGGPVGLTLAAHCAAKGRRVLIVESGLEQENCEHDALNTLESVGEPSSELQQARRGAFHGQQAGHWSTDRQPFGIRCRALGGSTHAWAGKSAPFDAIDFASRSWVAHSGWPVGYSEIEPYLRRAMDVLNLSPDAPGGRFESGGLKSQYWQFARSRVDRFDVMRFGSELAAQDMAGISILLDATVTHIAMNADGTAVTALSVESLSGKRARIEAGFCVLAAGGIENARLLLASNDRHASGIGNGHDQVGRYLMDHLGAQVATVPLAHTAQFSRKFGFFGVTYRKRAHMFMHGLALSPQAQAQEELMNAAIYFLPQRAPDDPWDALKRLLRRRSPQPGQDLLSVAGGAKLLAKGAGMKLLSSRFTPRPVKDLIVNSAIRLSPNLVVEEFVDAGIPHKLTGMTVEAICEHAPNPDSRITLSARRDRFGIPLARADWRFGEGERRTLLRLAELTSSALASANLPVPEPASWVGQGRTADSVIIDMGHTLGTTRMSANEVSGVVDAVCKVFGTHNLYVAGGSVFPTSGHANPTLTMLALAIRLGDHLNARLARG